jgi:small GTP-binding protein
LVGNGEVDSWYTLQKRTKRSNVTGKIHLKLLYTTVDKQDVYIDIKGTRDLSIKSTLYVKVKFGEGKGRTSERKSGLEDADWSDDKPLVMPYDETEKAIKFYVIDQDNRRSKVGIAQLPLSEVNMDEITDVWLPLLSLKKKDQQVGEMRVRVAVGDDVEALNAASPSASSSAPPSSKSKRKKEKKSKRSKKKKKSGATGDDDESEMSDSMSESQASSGGSESESDSMSSSASSSRRSSISARSTSRDDGPWTDDEDEDSILGSMSANFRPSGKVLIEIREARNLVGSGGGKKDVVFQASGDSQVFTSYVIRQTQNPVWNEMFAIRVSNTHSKIKIGLRDVNETKPTMGQVVLDVFQFESEPVSDWFHLRPASRKSDPVSGDVYITATYIPFTDNQYARQPTTPRLGIPPSPRGDLSETRATDPPIGTLHVLVLQAIDLSGKDGQLISSVKLHIDDGVEKITPTVKGTTNPVWTVGHGFQLPVYKVKNSELRFTVLDNLRAEAPGFLGQGTVALEQLAASDERTMERFFTLQRKLRKAKVTGRIRLRLRLELPRQKGDASLFSTVDLVDDSTKYDALFKVILIGESGVGKTGLFNRFNQHHFEMGSKATIGSEITSRTYRAEKKIVKVQLWDTAGQERFRAITRQYYRGANGAILVYDITSKASFDKLHSWLDDIKAYSNNPNLQLLLVGNKVRNRKQQNVSSQEPFFIIFVFNISKH